MSIDKFLEADATRNEWREDSTALYSIAISLKRIADAVSGDDDRLGLIDSLFEISARSKN